MPRGGKRPNAGRRRGSSTGPTGPQERTRVLRKKLKNDPELTAQATLEQIRRGSQFDIRKLFDKDGNLKPLHQLTAEEAMPIAGFEVVKKNLTAGDGKTDTVLKVKLIDRSRYVEMAAKHHGLLTEKIELTGELSLSEKVARARQRLAAAKG